MNSYVIVAIGPRVFVPKPEGVHYLVDNVPPMLCLAAPSQVYFGGGVGLFAQVGGAYVCVVCLFDIVES